MSRSETAAGGSRRYTVVGGSQLLWDGHRTWEAQLGHPIRFLNLGFVNIRQTQNRLGTKFPFVCLYLHLLGYTDI